MGVCGSIPEVEAPKQARSEEDELRISSEAQAAAKKRLSTIKIDKDEEEKLKEYKRHKGAAEELERSVKEIEDRESLALEVARKAEEERATKRTANKRSTGIHSRVLPKRIGRRTGDLRNFRIHCWAAP